MRIMVQQVFYQYTKEVPQTFLCLKKPLITIGIPNGVHLLQLDFSNALLILWGNGGANSYIQSITFPTSFETTTYSIGCTYDYHDYTKTVSGFSGMRHYGEGGYAYSNGNYICIGY